jgi:hypothetical protein
MRLLLCLLPFVAACSSYMQRTVPSGPPGPNEATVVFCRPARMVGSAVDFPIWDGEELVGFSEGGRAVEHRCAPGEHLFLADAQTYKAIAATLAGGQIYYVWITPRMGMLSAAVGFTPVRKEDAALLDDVRASLKETEFAAPIAEDCDPYEAKRREAIRQVVAEFREGKRTPEPPLRAEDGHREPLVPPSPAQQQLQRPQTHLEPPSQEP